MKLVVILTALLGIHFTPSVFADSPGREPGPIEEPGEEYPGPIEEPEEGYEPGYPPPRPQPRPPRPYPRPRPVPGYPPPVLPYPGPMPCPPIHCGQPGYPVPLPQPVPGYPINGMAGRCDIIRMGQGTLGIWLNGQQVIFQGRVEQVQARLVQLRAQGICF